MLAKDTWNCVCLFSQLQDTGIVNRGVVILKYVFVICKKNVHYSRISLPAIIGARPDFFLAFSKLSQFSHRLTITQIVFWSIFC